MKTWPTLTYLAISGLLLLAIGIGILFMPHAFFATNGITLGNDPNLLSETRAPGGLLTTGAILILLGVGRRDLRSTATTLAVLIYGSFGLARLLSMALDGMPSSGVLGATVIELVVAVIGLVILWRSHGAVSSSTARGPIVAPAVQ